ncbi:MAG TPA: hypothetical protein VFD90_16170 [Gaiellales bacterium]|nr:hypothetical protein [Gaiellales bacterium]
MKRHLLTACMLAALALALPSLALASGPADGTYKAKIATPAQLKGTWSLSFAKGGAYTIAQGSKVVVRGHSLSVAPQIKFAKETGPLACTSPGYYNFKRSGQTLSFKKLSDSCGGRALILAHRFTLAA